MAQGDHTADDGQPSPKVDDSDPAAVVGDLKAEDVLGRRLVAILQSKLEEGRFVNTVTTFYRLDSGVAFALPFADAGILHAEIPPADCCEVDCAELETIFGQRITAVLRTVGDITNCDDAPYLLLENGWLVTDVMSSEIGIGKEGIHLFAPGEVDPKSMTGFFNSD